MPESRSKSEAAKAKARLARAQKEYPILLAKTVKQNERAAAKTMRSVALSEAEAGKFKKEAASANAQALRARIGKRKPSNLHANAAVLKALLDDVRNPRQRS